MVPLKPQQNELLTRIEKLAPMGRYLRETSWCPAVLSSVLVPGDAPYSLRLLGEDYVAFRSTDGRVGFFAEACPHRGASLLLARNEGDSLRCIFHGWKFRVDGVTTEVPTQRSNHDDFCASVPLEHFPTHEAAGIVWVWLGKGRPASFPYFDFVDFPSSHLAPARTVLNFNWLQALEGLLDSAHVSILHSDWITKFASNPKMANAVHDTAPLYEFDERPGGFCYAAIRNLPNGDHYVRITEYIAPWYSFTPGDRGSCFICVPIDDEHTAFWSIPHDKDQPITESPLKPTSDPMNFPPPLPAGREGRWCQDRESMKNGSFSGFRHHFFHEDIAVAWSQGAIASREKEFLNAGDRAVVRVRSLLLEKVTNFLAGSVTSPNVGVLPIKVSAGHGTLRPGEDWRTRELA